jgi:hypothetical protein
VLALVLVNQQVAPTRVGSENAQPRAIGAQNIGDLRVAERAHVGHVIGTLDDHLVHAQGAHRPIEAVAVSCRLPAVCERRVFVRYDAQTPARRALAFVWACRWAQTSGGVIASLPAQKGQVSTLACFLVEPICHGRPALPGAMITQRPVIGSCLNSGIGSRERGAR